LITLFDFCVPNLLFGIQINAASGAKSQTVLQPRQGKAAICRVDMEMTLTDWPAQTHCMKLCRAQRRLWTVWQLCWARLLSHWGPIPCNFGQAKKRRNRKIISSHILISRSRLEFAVLDWAGCSAEVRAIGLIRHQEEPTFSVPLACGNFHLSRL